YWPSDAPRVRLLLLARHTTGWWDTLNQRTTGLAAELADSPLMLRDGELSLTDRAEHHSGALAAFAAHLPDRATPVEQIAPVLANPAFANPLLVHMHALLSVCGAQVSTTGTSVRERILNAVLARERYRWETTFPPGVPTGGPRTRHQAVTAATLLAPPTETATAQAMRVIGELAPEAAAGARAAVATWLHELYPGSDPPWAAPLRPDLLAEQLLAACPQLSELVLAGYGEISTREQLEQLLGELTRADARTQVHEALSQLLNAHLPGLLTGAIDVPSSRLPDLVNLALTHCPQPEAAATLASQFPEDSTGLAALAATVTSQATDHHRQLAAARPDTFTPDLAASLANLGLALVGLGRGEEALAAAGEAVAIYRQLAAARPDAFTPNLAKSLNNLSFALGRLGRGEEALAAAGEAVAIYRQLAAGRPDAFTPELARSVDNLAVALVGLGRGEEALAAAGEAVAIYRQLAAARPDTFTPDLARSLNNLAAALGRLARDEEALAVGEEAVAIYRQLAAVRPDAFTPDLARFLDNLTAVLDRLGRREEALAASGEAVAIYQQLAAADLDAFT
ncbi:MAG TPA: tetratricopeptide repeat protein, partial [Streptosporangiaceae bacterium]|nr:tetratricopeptide repeat protein [Streptosporangiaceae bacterium]